MYDFHEDCQHMGTMDQAQCRFEATYACPALIVLLEVEVRLVDSIIVELSHVQHASALHSMAWHRMLRQQHIIPRRRGGGGIATSGTSAATWRSPKIRLRECPVMLRVHQAACKHKMLSVIFALILVANQSPVATGKPLVQAPGQRWTCDCSS
jgi:hypothetical protein